MAMLFTQCTQNSQKNQEITGAWMFMDSSGMYNEALISNDFFIIHNDLMGTSISKILYINDGFFTISTEDDKSIKYQISNPKQDHFIIFNEFEKLELKSIAVESDINLIGQGHQEEIEKYWQEFRERQNSIDTTDILL
ncbi:hypothetical protein [Cyclobacterium sp.]|uniref:hypothetical protein n=1 Tax=Cyclobacterium sp. TaxID=1966343 RepID=UPI001988FDB9|nr:hypothetical protein [Cyclobacterium sp.]MBD3628165.1 hypothetical protein [Cyclobacterium sp.]